MPTPTKATPNQSKAKGATTPARKRSPTRPTMSKKSPYKSPKRAGKSTPKPKSTAKKLSPTRKAVVARSPTRDEKMQARLRAQEWAKNNLGQKSKSASSAPSTPAKPCPTVIIIDDDDDEEEVKPKIACTNTNKVGKAACNKCDDSCAKCKTIQQRMLELDIEHIKMKEAAVKNILTRASNEDIFYDALDSLPVKKNDVAVEDASDDEDDEIRDLRSAHRNRVPGRGQSWMEPTSASKKDPDGISFSTFVSKSDP